MDTNVVRSEHCLYGEAGLFWGPLDIGFSPG